MLKRACVRHAINAILLAGSLARPAVIAQTSAEPLSDRSAGEAVYRAACAGCHGPDGEGAPDSVTVFDRPATFPDFSQCDQTTPELDVDWKATIRDGGAARGFSRIMPAFGDALSSQQIDAVVAYLRTRCHDSSWPRGELNLPRPLATEKAFPEDETVLVAGIGAKHAPDITSTLVYEHRIGTRNQIEVSVPFTLQHGDAETAFGGIGDIGLGLKRVLHASVHTGSILSVQGEVILPTGNKARGLGSGGTVFEGFAAYAKLLPSHGFVQVQGGTEQPLHTDVAPRAVFGRIAAGRTFRADGGAGRLWAPMLELLADRDLDAGATTQLDLLPQFQMTLSKRQHVRVNAGVQVPVTHTAGRPVQLVFSVLWDWFDGGLLEGWK
jgi:mono/diheme cytochrome c family protein